MHTYLCVCVHVHACVLCIFVCKCACAHIRVHMCLFVCMCAYVCVGCVHTLSIQGIHVNDLEQDIYCTAK